jgi:chromosome segregation ATPase
MTDIRAYLESKRSEVRKAMLPLETSTASLRSELSTQDAKLRSLAKELSDIEKALQALGKKEKSESEITIKEAILLVLADMPNGLTAAEILAAINDRHFGGTVVRTSMSPQLARLKNDDHKIRQRGERYFLA